MWLLKTEPSSYGWSDLVAERRTTWDGVRNPVALRNMAAMQQGDAVLLYHTGKERAAVGLARVVRAAYPDPAFSNPKRLVVDVAAGEALARPVGLAELRGQAVFEGSPLLRQGRLSVVPLTSAQWRAVLALARQAAR